MLGHSPDTYNPVNFVVEKTCNKGAYEMSDEKHVWEIGTDPWGDDEENYDPDTYPWPDEGFMYSKWWSTSVVAEYHDMTTQGVADAVRAKRLIGKKLGSLRRGEWRILPESARRFEKHSKPPRKSSNS